MASFHIPAFLYIKSAFCAIDAGLFDYNCHLAYFHTLSYETESTGGSSLRLFSFELFPDGHEIRHLYHLILMLSLIAENLFFSCLNLKFSSQILLAHVDQKSSRHKIDGHLSKAYMQKASEPVKFTISLEVFRDDPS